MPLTSEKPIVIQISGLKKTYASGESELTVLEGINFELMQGESLAIVGPSGSGKTTLLGLCAGLDIPSAGSVELLETKLEALTEDGRAAFRGENVGFVFQNFQLIPTLTAIENVTVPLELRGINNAEAKARQLLDEVGLGKRTTHYPIQLSGGEQQRVALARAFINDPQILFADEPTGNLDGSNGGHVVDLLFDLNAQKGTTLVLVTHDLDLAKKCDKVLKLRDGRIETEMASA
ncbi:ABC transporter ATP-binding protein [Rubellicoccus peritrichatus]|uniref:ABC transporter ATP-binding protein n=1 Tax=Rubellicoccus peritrichatus TaxID=3080537 RepID=A0AAQ3LBM5_9BACT|nr:ABC transporter ATP-binding protein [Puniceicoccus sp. CR14]WOO42771.1 ABC transporter ATP-binding protein [Puniceicoccus sp. CR14]